MATLLLNLTPSLAAILKGTASIFDISPGRDGESSAIEADFQALRDDWMVLREDLLLALIRSIDEQEKSLQPRLREMLKNGISTATARTARDNRDAEMSSPDQLDFFKSVSLTGNESRSRNLEDAG